MLSFIFLCRCEFEDFPVTTNRFCKKSIYRKVIVLEVFGGKCVSDVSTKLSKICENLNICYNEWNSENRKSENRKSENLQSENPRISKSENLNVQSFIF